MGSMRFTASPILSKSQIWMHCGRHDVTGPWPSAVSRKTNKQTDKNINVFVRNSTVYVNIMPSSFIATFVTKALLGRRWFEAIVIFFFINKTNNRSQSLVTHKNDLSVVDFEISYRYFNTYLRIICSRICCPLLWFVFVKHYQGRRDLLWGSYTIVQMPDCYPPKCG